MSEQGSDTTDATLYDIEAVKVDERRRIAEHRKQRQVAKDSPYIGLGLSGGGIRSASFSLGVLQALNRFDVLSKIDYLSSVSGGGYIGSSFTWFNHVQAKAGKSWKFPFGTNGVGSRTSNQESPLNYLRQHCDYLKPSAELGGIAFFASFLRNSLLSFAVYFALIVTLFCLFTVAGAFSDIPPQQDPTKISWNGALVAAASLFALFVVLTVLYGLATFLLSSMSARDYKLRLFVQKLLGALVSLIVLAVALGSLPIVENMLDEWIVHMGGAMSTLGALGSAYEYRRRRAMTEESSGGNGSIRIAVTAIALIYGLSLLAYVIAQALIVAKAWSLVDVGLCVLLPSVVLGIFVDTNYFGPGRYYRDRLMEAFMPGEETVRDNKWRPAFAADRTKLSEMCGSSERGPYHLINCNLILVDSSEASFRGRGGDSFTLSPLFCGGTATSWCKTASFIKDKMTIATAMSISGAALSPNAANNGSGATRSRTLSFLLSLLNLRLGYYVTNPAVAGWRKWIAWFSHPNFYFPGLVQGLLGLGLNEKASYLSLSDGGHFENCGLYELVRRRLDVIFISEAGADADYTMSDLANAIERIRVDFGYHIHFPDAFGIEAMLPGSAGSVVGNDDIKLATRGFAIGDIYYGKDESGTERSGKIVYLQAVLTKNLPPELFSYRKLSEFFPNEPTTDQFFNEAQLEAYRELGYQLCKELIAANAGPGGKGKWF